ncbi:GT-D fold domain-containing glycosyltransferase [Limosilactobacillus equigenerosi]|uniref:GT-D fold domain-containing glycosyltransferase n=1 Tax=Limosilactobacillus equigenerosi TaxID=417373 RepID=UPI0006D0B2E3|nr:GT-D fold domain-containing glycosyltransferase [Limosilactobacillus equigenerosi]
MKKINWFGSTFISRPYIDLKDKSSADRYFSLLKSLWKDRDLLIVEGKTSRAGQGNDLFDTAKSIHRIIAPSKDAFSKYDELFLTIKKWSDNKLVLLMLGPTAKLLSYDLSCEGIQAIDIGHIDSEYEWFLMGALQKVKLPHKHTAEFNFDNDIDFVIDDEYESQIIADIS